MLRGSHRFAQRGASLLEVTLSLGLSGLLAMAGLAGWESGGAALSAAALEIRGGLEEAFVLARARGTNVTVALGQATGEGEHLPVHLPRQVRWGKPDHIPLPPDMAAPTVASRTGEAHPVLTVTPRRTALASTWFLNDGREALCMRLSGKGHLYVLRWRRDLRMWVRS